MPFTRCGGAGGGAFGVLVVGGVLGTRKPPNHHWLGGFSNVCSAGVLLSHTLSSAVPSALKGLASGFGMGPGVPLRYDRRNSMKLSQ